MSSKSKGIIREGSAPMDVIEKAGTPDMPSNSPEMQEVSSVYKVTEKQSDQGPQSASDNTASSITSPPTSFPNVDGSSESFTRANSVRDELKEVMSDNGAPHAKNGDLQQDFSSPSEIPTDSGAIQNLPSYQRPPANPGFAKNSDPGERQVPECPVPVSYDYDSNYWVCLDAPQSYLSSLQPGSRLFIGNLASEHTDKVQIARIFAKYGNIAEISLKESYGFVQFDNPEACREAICAEQGRVIAGMVIDLKSSRKKYPGRKNDDFGGYPGRKFDRDSRGVETNSRRMNRRGGSRDKGNRPSARSRREDRVPGVSDDGRNRGSSVWRSRHSKVRGTCYDGRVGGVSRTPSDFLHGGNHPLNKGFLMHNNEPDMPYPQNSVLEHSNYGSWSSMMPGPPSQSNCFYNEPADPGSATFSHSVADNPYPRISQVLPSTGALNLPTRHGASIPECQIVVFRGASRSFVFHVKDVVRRGDFVLDVMHLSTKIPVRDVIYKVASEGVLGLILIRWRYARDRLVTLHTFINGSKTMEYDGISVETATYILQKERSQSSEVLGAPAYPYGMQSRTKFKPEPHELPSREINQQVYFDKNIGLISNLSSILVGLNEMRTNHGDGKNSLLGLLKNIQKKRQYETQGTTGDLLNSGNVDLGANSNEIQRPLQQNKSVLNLDAVRSQLSQSDLQLINSSTAQRGQADLNSAQIDALKLSYALSQVLSATEDRPNNSLPSDLLSFLDRSVQKNTESGISHLPNNLGLQQRTVAGNPNLININKTTSQRPILTQQSQSSVYESRDLFPGVSNSSQYMGTQAPSSSHTQASNPTQESVANVLERLKQLYQTQTQSKETHTFM